MSGRRVAGLCLTFVVTACSHGRSTSEGPACSEFWPIGTENVAREPQEQTAGAHVPAWAEAPGAEPEADDGGDGVGESDAPTPEPLSPAEGATAMEHSARALATLRRTSSGRACEQAAAALASLGLAIEETPISEAQARRARALTSGHAEGVRAACGRSFDTIRRMQAGLEALLGAMAEDGATSDLGVKPWLESAREAVADLTPGRPTALQRSALQDALRTVYDALVFASLTRKDEPSSHASLGIAHHQPSGGE